MQHVAEIGLLSAGDPEIWDFAAKQGLVIVTKDADFIALSALRTGPQVVSLRYGITRKVELRERLAPLLPRIVAALEAGERLVEVA